MTGLTDLWDLPEPHGYHNHDGEQVPFYYINSLIQEAGKESERIDFGLLCIVCGFTPTPRVVRMSLETELGFEPSEQPAPEEEEEEWPQYQD